MSPTGQGSSYRIRRIKWNEVTWYSRLAALVLFLGIIPALCFYIGTQYESLEVSFNDPFATSPVSTVSIGNTSMQDLATTTPSGTYGYMIGTVPVQFTCPAAHQGHLLLYMGLYSGPVTEQAILEPDSTGWDDLSYDQRGYFIGCVYKDTPYIDQTEIPAAIDSCQQVSQTAIECK